MTAYMDRGSFRGSWAGRPKPVHLTAFAAAVGFAISSIQKNTKPLFSTMSPHSRRKSVDSSDSSSGSDNDHGGKDSHKKEKKDKKDKDKKDKDKKDKKKSHHQEGQAQATNYGHSSTADIDNRQARLHTSQIMDYEQGPPPAYPPPLPRAPSSHPPSGYRVPLTTENAFPPPAQAGPAVAHDLDGSPIFIGSAIMDSSVHPCKIGPHLQPYVAVPYGGAEFGHHGRYDLLPFDGASMEWVPTSHGRIPPGRSPVEGGYEEGGEKLYHALGDVNGVKVPGKTGEHL